MHLWSLLIEEASFPKKSSAPPPTSSTKKTGYTSGLLLKPQRPSYHRPGTVDSPFRAATSVDGNNDPLLYGDFSMSDTRRYTTEPSLDVVIQATGADVSQIPAAFRQPPLQDRFLYPSDNQREYAPITPPWQRSTWRPFVLVSDPTPLPTELGNRYSDSVPENDGPIPPSDGQRNQFNRYALDEFATLSPGLEPGSGGVTVQKPNTDQHSSGRTDATFTDRVNEQWKNLESFDQQRMRDWTVPYRERGLASNPRNIESFLRPWQRSFQGAPPVQTSYGPGFGSEQPDYDMDGSQTNFHNIPPSRPFFSGSFDVASSVSSHGADFCCENPRIPRAPHLRP